MNSRRLSTILTSAYLLAGCYLPRLVSHLDSARETVRSSASMHPVESRRNDARRLMVMGVLGLVLVLFLTGTVAAQDTPEPTCTDPRGCGGSSGSSSRSGSESRSARDSNAEYNYYNGDLDGAIADLSRSIDLNPAFSKAYSSRGVARRDKGDLDGALGDYTKAIELDPRSAVAFSNRGVVRHDKGDLRGAHADSVRALEIDPQEASVYNSLGVIYADDNELDSAIFAFSAAIGQRADYAEAFWNRSQAKRRKGARTDREEAIRLDPRFKQRP
jgi:tetratricopeptide (TPR) repeat protein